MFLLEPSQISIIIRSWSMVVSYILYCPFNGIVACWEFKYRIQFSWKLPGCCTRCLSYQPIQNVAQTRPAPDQEERKVHPPRMTSKNASHLPLNGLPRKEQRPESSRSNPGTSPARLTNIFPLHHSSARAPSDENDYPLHQ